MPHPWLNYTRQYGYTFVSAFTFSTCSFLFIKDNIFSWHNVRGPSMAPTISPTYHETGQMDVVLLKKWKPTVGMKRGDIVSFWAPHNPQRTSIKRVVGTEGDVVYPDKRYPIRKVVVPHGHIWVEGDNWRKTFDSNDYGPISMNLIDGRASAIIWPPSRFGEIKDKRSSKHTRVEAGESMLPQEYWE